jgi:phage-related protein
MSKRFRKVEAYEHYFADFVSKQRQKVRDKIFWTLRLIEELERVPESYLKSFAGAEGLFEIRIKHGGDIFRIFCFFDEDKLVILMNGFQKKTQKTPKQEIEKALKIRDEYYAEKS